MFRKLLVPLDGSTLAEQALSPAAAIARSCNAAIELVLVHTGLTPAGMPHLCRAGDPEESVYLQDLARDLAWRFNVPVSAHVTRGEPTEAIVRRASETGADIIVMTSHGRTGLSRAWFGSVADGVVRESTIPVLIERPIAGRRWRDVVDPPFRRILIPLDGTQFAASMLKPALDLCRWLEARPVFAQVVAPVTVSLADGGVPLYPPMVFDDEATRSSTEHALDQLTDLVLDIEADWRMRSETAVVVNSNAALGILEIAARHNVDMIAMSTHARGASRLLLGSVTDKVLRGTTLPLLLLHPSEEPATTVEPLREYAHT